MFFCVYLFILVCMCALVWVLWHTYKGQRTWKNSVLLYVGPREWTQIFSLGNWHLYQLICLLALNWVSYSLHRVLCWFLSSVILWILIGLSNHPHLKWHHPHLNCYLLCLYWNSISSITLFLASPSTCLLGFSLSHDSILKHFKSCSKLPSIRLQVI